MPTPLAISATVKKALEAAILREDYEALADAFAEMYVLAQAGVGKLPYAKGVDDLALRVLTRNTGE